jgi:hypothetical protein
MAEGIWRPFPVVAAERRRGEAIAIDRCGLQRLFAKRLAGRRPALETVLEIEVRMRLGERHRRRAQQPGDEDERADHSCGSG